MNYISRSVRHLTRDGRAFTPEQAKQAGISHQLLADYCRKGMFIRQGYGVYVPAENHVSEYPEIEVLQKRGTDFVLCLLSALRFHEFTTQNPTEVWIAVKQGSRTPRVDFGMRCIHFSDKVYSFGIKEHTMNGLPVKIYSPAKTVADCFKFRNQYGLDTALEALRDGWRQHKFTIAELDEAARVCRVQRVITPYVEMMVNEP